jgi:hypothetical protein
LFKGFSALRAFQVYLSFLHHQLHLHPDRTPKRRQRGRFFGISRIRHHNPRRCKRVKPLESSRRRHASKRPQMGDSVRCRIFPPASHAVSEQAIRAILQAQLPT